MRCWNCSADCAGIDDGMDTLAWGCSWGSLCLWIAEHFPNCRRPQGTRLGTIQGLPPFGLSSGTLIIVSEWGGRLTVPLVNTSVTCRGITRLGFSMSL